MSGKAPLVIALRHEIETEGPMPFSRFMERALYDPEYGYYTDPSVSPIGRGGDFYTSVSVGALFGQLMAQQIEEMWELMDRPSPFVIIEQGANDARFAADILGWLRQHRPDLFQATTYHIIEPSETIQARQIKTLKELNLNHSVSWNADLTESIGVFISNELIDSFPVHRVVYSNGTWLESHVVWEDHHFAWKNLPITLPSLAEAVRILPLPSIENYTTEINLRSRPWIQSVAARLRKGFVITIDYGYLEDTYYKPERNEGTLLCYQKHQRSTDPLRSVGEQDITTHVDFSALIKSGESAGLTTLGFTDQHHFMIGLAHDELLAFEARGLPLDPHYAETARAFRTLMHPEIMGTSFKYLIQAKGLPLSG